MDSLSRRPVTFAALAAGLLLGSVAPASAVSIDFNVGPPLSGLITHFDSGPLVGTDISIDSVTGNGTPGNASTFACDCTLNFTSGPLMTSGPNFWVFEGGGEITIDGTMTTPGGDVDVEMVGTFVGPQLTIDVFTPGIFDFGLSLALFVDSKNEALTSFFGLPGGEYNGYMALGWVGFADENGGDILATPLGGVVSNSPVPEPGTMLLLGAGLLGLAGARRRRGSA